MRAVFGIPVIGVAKSRFGTATHAVPVVRGSSARPLFITAAGMPAADAADLIRRMTGRYRLPDALRRADTLARTGPPAATRTAASPTDLRTCAERGMHTGTLASSSAAVPAGIFCSAQAAHRFRRRAA